MMLNRRYLVLASMPFGLACKDSLMVTRNPSGVILDNVEVAVDHEVRHVDCSMVKTTFWQVAGEHVIRPTIVWHLKVKRSADRQS